MADRWRGRPTLAPGQGQLYWHVLLGDHPQVRALASEAHRRLADLPGLDLTPHRWLHLTTFMVGLSDEITAMQRDAMVTEAGRRLAGVQPVTVSLARVLYHPEAIALAVRPADVLTPLLEAVQAATRDATRRDGSLADQPWTPHVTVAYSSAVQPAAPIIAALGRELPPCEVTIRSISLVNQDGPEYLWNWHPIAEVHLGTADRHLLLDSDKTG
jgi:2'-5' RNA ligase